MINKTSEKSQIEQTKKLFYKNILNVLFQFYVIDVKHVP